MLLYVLKGLFGNVLYALLPKTNFFFYLDRIYWLVSLDWPIWHLFGYGLTNCNPHLLEILHLYNSQDKMVLKN